MPSAVRVPDRIASGDFADVPVGNAGAAGKALIWNNSTQMFDYITPLAIGGSNGQVQFNNSGALAGDAGLTYDTANDALTVAGRVVVPVIRPSSDSTTAIKIQNAAGSSDIFTIDTTNQRVGIGGAPGSAPLVVNGVLSAYCQQWLMGGVNAGMYSSTGFAGLGTITASDWRVFVNNNSSLGITIKNTTGLMGINNTAPSAYIDLPASTTSNASLRIRSGVAPTTPNDGDIWFDGTNIKARIGGVTKTFTLT